MKSLMRNGLCRLSRRASLENALSLQRGKEYLGRGGHRAAPLKDAVDPSYLPPGRGPRGAQHPLCGGLADNTWLDSNQEETN